MIKKVLEITDLGKGLGNLPSPAVYPAAHICPCSQEHPGGLLWFYSALLQVSAPPPAKHHGLPASHPHWRKKDSTITFRNLQNATSPTHKIKICPFIELRTCTWQELCLLLTSWPLFLVFPSRVHTASAASPKIQRVETQSLFESFRNHYWLIIKFVTASVFSADMHVIWFLVKDAVISCTYLRLRSQSIKQQF